MAAEQIMTQVVMQGAVEAAKAVIMAVKEADDPVRDARAIHTSQIGWSSTETASIWLGYIQILNDEEREREVQTNTGVLQ